MNISIQNAIIVISALATIVLLLLGGIDFLVKYWRGIKRIAVWLRKQVINLRPDFSAVSLHIPPARPAATLPVGTSDGVTKTPVKFIMRGPDQLFAYTVTREGLSRYLVERKRPGQQPQFILTLNRDAANDKWNEWYQEWKQKGFGGAFGTDLSDEPPFGS